ESVGVAGRRHRVRALAQRVLTVGNRGAGARAAGQRAVPAGAGAGGPATDPLLAHPGVALGGIAAGRAERLLAAAAVEAAVRRHAISVVRADHQALAVAAADERRARLIRRRHAGAVAVAARGGFQRRAAAGLLGADDAGGVLLAGARAVAGAVRAATRRAHVVAFVAWVGADISRHAGADRALQRARHADVVADGVAADAIDAESAFALGREETGRAQRLTLRSAAVGARRIRAHIARAAVGGFIDRDVARRRVVRRVLAAGSSRTVARHDEQSQRTDADCSYDP